MRPGLADLALVLVVAVWGWTFAAVKEATESVPVLTFLALRFGVATAAFIPLLLLASRGGRSRSAGPGVAGVAVGVVLSAGYVLQTYGLSFAAPGRSGVITGISVVLVPFGAWVILRQRIGSREWIGVALAVIGFALLAFGEEGIARGDWLVLGCAVAFATQVVALARIAPGRAVLPLAFAQVATAAVGLTIAAAIVDLPAGLPAIPRSVWGAVLTTGIVATTAGFAVQTWAQRTTTPTRIALILALEPVFAMGASRMLTGETYSVTALAGAGCILAGMLAAELGPRTASQSTAVPGSQATPQEEGSA